MYRLSSGHLVYFFRVARREREGGSFRNFRVVMCRCDTGISSLYFRFSWILLLYTKLNFPNSSLSKSCSLISISSPRLSCLNTIPYKAEHYISHLASLSKLECGLQEINSREIRLHLTFSANWNKLDRVSKKSEFILKVAFSLPSPSSMLKLPIKRWRQREYCFTIYAVCTSRSTKSHFT